MSDSPFASANPPPNVAVLSGLSELSGRYDLILCDVWGVLHDGLKAFPAAGDALSRFRAGGGRVVLISNAPRPGSFVSAQLDQYGVPREAYDDVVTSGDVTRTIIAEHGDEPLFHLGPERDLGLFDGLRAGLVRLEEASYVVCTGLFDDENETVGDYAATLRAMRARDQLMVCANPDLVVERGERLILCAGSLAAAYDAIGGRTITGGKPHRPIYVQASEAGERLLGRAIEADRILAIGDAIRTDIAGARDFGIDALLIARGIHATDLGYVEGRLDTAIGLAWLTDQAHQPTAIAAALTWS